MADGLGGGADTTEAAGSTLSDAWRLLMVPARCMRGLRPDSLSAAASC
jgi:hypothetical protein